MEWISVKERLPEHGKVCWVYGIYEEGSIHKFVFRAIYEIRELPFSKKNHCEWIVCECENEYISVELKCVSHWMPYYSPKPPGENVL